MNDATNALAALGIVDSSPDGIVLFDLGTRVVFANRQFGTLWNISPSSLPGMTQAELQVHKLAMLSDPDQDAHLLSAGPCQESEADTQYIRLKTGVWYERLVFDYRVDGACRGHVVQWRDVTKRHDALVLVQTERDLLHAMMDSVPDQIYFKDTQSRFTRVNKSLAARYGVADTREVIGKSDADFYSAEHAALTRREELEIMSTLTPQLSQLHHEVWSDGREAWNISTKMPLLDSKGNVLGVYGIAHDITEQKRAEAEIWRQANFDPLTNLPNRRLMLDRWEQAAQLHRRNGSKMALILVDLDRFKEINDTLGHASGDELLIQAARRMSLCLRAADTLARLGGDEFAVIVCEVATPEDIQIVADKILGCLNAPFHLPESDVQIAGSVGVSMYPDDGEMLESLLRSSDRAMYQVKNRGGNGYALFNQLPPQ